MHLSRQAAYWSRRCIQRRRQHETNMLAPFTVSPKPRVASVLSEDAWSKMIWLWLQGALRPLVMSFFVLAWISAASAQDVLLDTSALTDSDLVEALTTGFSLNQDFDGTALLGDDVPIAARLEGEKEKLAAILHGFGYLDGGIFERATAFDGVPELAIDAGAQYLIGAVAVTLDTVKEPSWIDDIKGLSDTVVGLVARGSVIRQLTDRLTARLEQSGYPFASASLAEVIPIPQTKLALVRITLDPGKQAVFGPVELAGGRLFKIDKLEEILPFSPGELYAPAKVDALRASLAAIPNLRAARVSLASQLDPNGQLAISVRVAERVDIEHGQSDIGRLALLAVLILLAPRQVTTATGISPHSPMVQSQTILIIIAMAFAALFVARRFVNFALPA